MKPLFKILILLTLLPYLSFAQRNYKSGYVVTLKGDTLHGYIDFRDWDKNPDEISFKKAITDRDVQKFTTSTISSFNIYNIEAYEKYEGMVSMDIINISNLSEGRDTSIKQASVFLKVLQKGKNVSLFSYSDDLKPRFFVGEAHNYKPVELIYRIYLNQDAATSKARTVNQNTYMRQLYAIAQKYNVLTDTLQQDIQHMDYNKPEILKIVSKINRVSESDYSKNYSEKTKSSLFVSGILNITNTSPATSSPYYGAGGKAYTSYQPGVSFGIDLLANPNTGKLRFRIEASFIESQYRVSYQNKVYPYVGIKSTFNETWMSFSPQIIYNFYNADNLKFYMGAGIAFTYYKYSNVFFGNPSSAENFAQITTYDFNSFDNPVLIKAGIQFAKHWGININYLTTVATTRGGYFQLNKNGEQIGLFYFLK